MIEYLPAVNATLNSISTILILTGFYFIRKKNIIAHKICLLSAVSTSTLFLISYLIYHYTKTTVTTFKGVGLIKTIYYGILISHSILAVVIVPLVLVTVIKGLKDHRESHRKIAVWTFPLWLYVSATGVIIYIFLYQLYP